MTFKDWFTKNNEDGTEYMKALTDIRMSDSEKTQTREFLTRYMQLNPVRSTQVVKNTPTRSSFFSFNPMPLIAGFLIVVVSGGSVAAAAEAALPGDRLYPIKVNVNEEVRLALATSPERKADVTLARAETRVKEIEILEERGADETIKMEAEDRLDAHLEAAEAESVAANEVDEDDRSREKRENRLVALLRVHETRIMGVAVGGSIEPEVTIDMMMAADMASTAEETPTLMMSLAVEEPAPMKKSATSNAEELRAESNTADEISEKTLKRERRAAEKRIEAFAKLVAREKRAVSADARATLQKAEDAFAEGKTSMEAGNFGEASVFFNIALRAAIDGRELLNTKSETRNDSQNREDRNDSNDETRTNTEVNISVDPLPVKVEINTRSTSSDSSDDEEEKKEDESQEEDKKEPLLQIGNFKIGL